MVIQFGLSLVIPVLACLYGAWWLTENTSVGGWVFIPALILGIGASCMTWYKLYLRYENKRRKEEAAALPRTVSGTAPDGNPEGSRQETAVKKKQAKRGRKGRKPEAERRASFNAHL